MAKFKVGDYVKLSKAGRIDAEKDDYTFQRRIDNGKLGRIVAPNRFELPFWQVETGNDSLMFSKYIILDYPASWLTKATSTEVAIARGAGRLPQPPEEI